MSESQKLRADRDKAYYERNRVVAALAHVFPAGIRKTDIEGWEPEWHNCVFIDTPAGQLSWHYHDRDIEAFADLPAYQRPWDGHTTEEKYERLAKLCKLSMMVAVSNVARR